MQRGAAGAPPIAAVAKTEAAAETAARARTEPAAKAEAASTERSGRCVAGRYRLLGVLGRGGHGEVWEAEDALTGALVAVKLLGDSAGVEPARVRREVAALRLLRLPGVVPMLDEGIDGGAAFLVMERVSGAPFPGRGRKGWSELAGVTAALLETLSRIHAAGVVHRDLKPGNVLVDDLGRPTILDFGLSFGASLGLGLTGEGRVLGTPDYLAPEQILGDPITPATDLYAIGVVLFEALSGRLPHEADDFQTLMRVRLTEAPPPLRDVAPDVPPAVAAAVDALLAIAPAERPRSADELLSRLAEQRPSAALDREPHLGSRDAIQRVCEAARAGRSMDVVGLAGAGRTRCLQEAAAALAAEGVAVLWTAPGKRPLASLEAIAGLVREEPGQGLGDVTAAIERRLAEWLGAGKVLFADDACRLDRWSAEVLDRARGAGAIVRVLDVSGAGEGADEREGVTALHPLREADLAALFAGPDRIFHLREDAAAELFLRTAGLPAAVLSEVASWERAGLCRRDGALRVVERGALDRLAAQRAVLPPPPLLPPARPSDGADSKLPPHLEDLAVWIDLSWPHTRLAELSRITEQPAWRLEAEVDELVQRGWVARLSDGRLAPWRAKGIASRRRPERRRSAHRALVRALREGSEGRLFHLLAAESEPAAEIEKETVALVTPLVHEGHLGLATALLRDGWLAARRAVNDEGTTAAAPLLGLWVRVALSDGTPGALDQVLYELCRASDRGGEVGALERLVRAALAMRTTAGDRALALIDESVAPFADAEMERRRQHVRAQSARLCPVEREEAVLTDLEAWVKRTGSVAAKASHADWLGRLRYRQGRFDEAADLHAEAAAFERWISERTGMLLNGASALLEALRFDETVRMAEEAGRLAAGCRHAYYEARSEWLVRSARYRRGDSMAPDEELVELAARTGVLDLEALVCLNEAAVAFQGSSRVRAGALARRAERIWRAAGKSWGALFARVLGRAASGAVAEDEARSLAEDARRCPVPGAGIQMLGLLAAACPRVAEEVTPAMERLRAAIPERCWPLRMDVLSVDEAFRMLAGEGLLDASERHGHVGKEASFV